MHNSEGLLTVVRLRREFLARDKLARHCDWIDKCGDRQNFEIRDCGLNMGCQRP